MNRINYGINKRAPLQRIRALESAGSAELYDRAARHDHNPDVRRYSLQKLYAANKHAHSSEYESTLTDAITEDKDRDVRIFAMKLADKNPAVVRALGSAAIDMGKSPTERAAAIKRLGEFGENGIVNHAAESDPNYIPRAEAAKHLKDIGLLKQLLRSENSENVRTAAAESLISLMKDTSRS